MVPQPLFVRDGHPDHPASGLIFEDGDSDVESTDFDDEMKRKRVIDEDEEADQGNNDVDIDITAKPTNGEAIPPKDGLVLGGGKTIKLMLVPDNPPIPPPPPPAKPKKPHPQA